jgi:CheY-like chemotaxis protein
MIMNHREARGTILLVEDDFVLRTSLAELLMSHGYEVECAAHGIEAFHRLTILDRRPSVILLDLMMPYMDGLEFRAIQRVLPALADVPVVVITANLESAVEAADLDVAETFYKPVNTGRLLDRIDELTAPAAA